MTGCHIIPTVAHHCSSYKAAILHAMRWHVCIGRSSVSSVTSAHVIMLVAVQAVPYTIKSSIMEAGDIHCHVLAYWYSFKRSTCIGGERSKLRCRPRAGRPWCVELHQRSHSGAREKDYIRVHLMRRSPLCLLKSGTLLIISDHEYLAAFLVSGH